MENKRNKSIWALSLSLEPMQFGVTIILLSMFAILIGLHLDCKQNASIEEQRRIKMQNDSIAEAERNNAAIHHVEPRYYAPHPSATQ